MTITRIAGGVYSVTLDQLSEAFRAIRIEQCMTQADLGERISMKVPQISAIEMGTGGTTLRTVERLATGLGRRVIVMLIPEHLDR